MPKSSAKSRTKSSSKASPSNTLKRDFPTRKKLPGYWRFSREVWGLLWGHRYLFLKLVVVAVIALTVISFAAEQEQYSSLSEATHMAVKDLPDAGTRALIATGVLFSSVLSGSLSSALSEQQHIYRAAVLGFLWLVTVWLLRHLLTSTTVKLRDGLYNAGAPLLSTSLVVLVGAIQLLPLALTVSLFAALLTTGALNQVVVTAVLAVVLVVLTVLTIYWLVGTLFAAIIVTIPGTYPLAALRSARKIVVGYRAVLLLRLLWLAFVLFVVHTVVMLPLLFLDAAAGFSSPPLIVLLNQLLGVVLLLYAFGYIYLLYRKIIDGRSE